MRLTGGRGADPPPAVGPLPRAGEVAAEERSDASPHRAAETADAGETGRTSRATQTGQTNPIGGTSPIGRTGRIRGVLAGRGRGWLVVLAGFFGVRIMLWSTGVRFSTGHLEYPSLWHLLDPEQLERNPLVALWDLHIQPPLFNLLVGVVLRWSPAPEAVSFQVLWAALGLVGALLLYELLRAFSVRWWVAALVTIVVFSEPVLIEYEHVVTYEALLTTLILAATWACHRYARSPTLGRFGLLVGLATTLVLTRALFHPLWLVLVMALVLVLRPPQADWHRTALVVAVPLALVLGLMVRNQVRFGTFSLSSWFGMNMHRATVDGLPPDEKDALIAEGVISPQARIKPFMEFEQYRPFVDGCRADFGSAVLDQPEKADGSVNYNYACFIPVYEQAQRDAWAVMRHRPHQYVTTTVHAAAITYVSDLHLVYIERSGPTSVLDEVHDTLGLEVGTEAPYPAFPIPQRVHLTLLVSLVGLVGVGAWATGRRWRDRPQLRRRHRRAGPRGDDGDEASSGDEPRDESWDDRSSRQLTLAFVGLTLAFATTTSVLFELWENARFRLPFDPLLVGAALALVVEGGLRGWGSVRRARQGSAPGDPEAPDRRRERLPV